MRENCVQCKDKHLCLSTKAQADTYRPKTTPCFLQLPDPYSCFFWPLPVTSIHTILLTWNLHVICFISQQYTGTFDVYVNIVNLGLLVGCLQYCPGWHYRWRLCYAHHLYQTQMETQYCCDRPLSGCQIRVAICSYIKTHTHSTCKRMSRIWNTTDPKLSIKHIDKNQTRRLPLSSISCQWWTSPRIPSLSHYSFPIQY